MKNKFMIKGYVLCPCGGQILSNSGKAYYNHEKNTVACWNCHKEYNAEEIYNQRQENKGVTYKQRVEEK